MNTTMKDKTIIVDFTPAELVDFLKNFRMEDTDSRKIDNSFCKYSFEETLRFVEYGWEDGVGEIDARLETSKTTAGIGEDYGIVSGVSGDFFDVGLVLSGEPECWYSMEKIETPQQELNLIVHSGYSNGINQNPVYNRGAVITNIVDRLRRQYYVNLRFVLYAGGVSSYCKGELKFTEIILNVNIDTKNHYSRSFVAFVVANPAFCRRTYFTVLETLCENNNCGRYGHTLDITLTPEEKKASIYFPKIDSNSDFCTIEAAEETVKNMVAEYL